MPFAPPGPVELLGEELRRIGFDPTYGEALRMAAFFSAQRPAPEAAGVRRQGS